MQAPPTVLSQVTDTLFRAEFSRCVQKFPTMRPTRNFSEYEHFLALCFAQLTFRESLRDIVACLKSKGSALYHLGFRGRLSRSNLAYANRHRDWRMFQAVAEVLMRRAARLYQDCVSDPELPTVAFALDSSLIGKSLNEILQIVSVSIFEQVPLKELLGTTQVPECQKTLEDENRNLLL